VDGWRKIGDESCMGWWVVGRHVGGVWRRGIISENFSLATKYL